MPASAMGAAAARPKKNCPEPITTWFIVGAQLYARRRHRPPLSPAVFPSTSWTILAQATLSGDAGGREALGRLCENYRLPVIHFLRLRGWGQEDAEDFAQELFAKLLTGKVWKQADRSRGKFRNYLLVILQRLVSNHLRQQTHEKNGSRQSPVSLDWLEDEYGWEQAETAGDEALEFDRAWAHRAMQTACARVQANWQERGKGAEWEVLARFLPGPVTPPSHAEAAAELGRREQAVRTAVSRLRAELGAALRAEVAKTVASPEEVEPEMQHLMHVLSARRNNLV
jgi:DNA-directed RNA polymerase specialized sigma24 family protein